MKYYELKNITRNKSLSKSEKLEYFRQFFIENGYELISTEYPSDGKSLIFCKNDHTFSRLPKLIVSKGLVGLRPLRSNEYYMNKCKEMAEMRGGKIISTKYLGIDTKLICEDSKGNIFYKSPYLIIKGSWSPYEGIVGEHICRQAFEYIFKVSFNSNWNIINRCKQKNLQLDGYNDNVIIDGKSYKIAFEYQGHQNHCTDKETMERDAYKVRYCEENQIILIIIDYITIKNINNSKWIIEHILNLFNSKLNMNINCDIEPFKIDYMKIQHNNDQYKKILEIGYNNGYELLDSEYISSSFPLTWKRYSDGYIFKRSANKIQAEGWGDFTNRGLGLRMSKEEHLNVLRNISKNRGGELLSQKWIGAKEKYKFIDISGNVFYASGLHIKSGKWSPFETPQAGAKYKKDKNKLSITMPNNDVIVYRIDNNIKILETFIKNVIS